MNIFIKAVLLDPKASIVDVAVEGSIETNLKQKSVETIKVLAKHGCDVNSSHNSFLSPLHTVCKNNDGVMAKALLDCGANVNIFKMGRKTILDVALDNRQPDLMKLLLNYNANVTKEHRYEGTVPLFTACYLENTAKLKLFIEYGSDVNYVNRKGLSVLQEAFKAGVFDNVTSLLEAGADVNYVDAKKWTMLHCASEQTNVDVLKLALDKGMDVNARNVDGNTPLHIACANANNNIVKVLIENGARLDVVNNEGSTVLHTAALNRNADQNNIVKLLKDEGVDIEHLNQEGLTALQEACYQVNFKLVKALIENKANLHVTDLHKNTLLHLICESDRIYDEEKVNIIRLLIESGIDVDVANEDGYTPLHQSSFVRNPVHILDFCGVPKFLQVKTLVECGANVNALTNRNETVLHIAAEYGSHLDNDVTRIIRFLIKSGVDVNQANEDGYTAVYKAIEKCCASQWYDYQEWSLVYLLIDKGASLNDKIHDLLIGNFAIIVVNGQIKLLQMLLKSVSIEEINIDIKKFPPGFPLQLAKQDGCFRADLLLEMTRYVKEFRDRNKIPDHDFYSRLYEYLAKKFEERSSSTNDS